MTAMGGSSGKPEDPVGPRSATGSSTGNIGLIAKTFVTRFRESSARATLFNSFEVTSDPFQSAGAAGGGPYFSALLGGDPCTACVGTKGYEMLRLRSVMGGRASTLHFRTGRLGKVPGPGHLLETLAA